MKKNIVWLLLFISVLMLVLPGCSGNKREAAAPVANNAVNTALIIKHVAKDVTVDTTWLNTKLYILDNTIYVSAHLTIQPGTIIKFASGCGLSTSDSGMITAIGTSTSHIIFTSLKDDTKGGDTNGNRSATLPLKGDWTSISITTDGSSFSYCEIYYGGKGTYADDTMLCVNNASTPPSVSITNCTFAHSKRSGLNVSGSAAGTGTTGTTVSGNTFFDTTKPLWISVNTTIPGTNVFHNPSNTAQGNTCNGIWLEGSVTVNADTSWGVKEVPFVLTNGVSVEATLTLKSGVILKFLPDTRMDISGSGAVVAVGSSTKHITFTSFADDTKGGDTNQNGTTTVPAKGDWCKVWIGGSGISNFTYCDFYYGGNGNYDDSALVEFALDATATIDHCTFANSLHAALNIEGAKDTTVITNNAFFNTTMPLWMSPDFSIPGSNIFHNPVIPTQKNKQNGIWLQASQDVRANRAWGVTEVPYVCPTFGTYDYITLNIAQGAVLKFEQGAELVKSTGVSIPNFASVIFTSLKDDTHGGNTDGVAVTPTNSDWRGVWDYDYPLNDHWRTDGNILYSTNQ